MVAHAAAVEQAEVGLVAPPDRQSVADGEDAADQRGVAALDHLEAGLRQDGADAGADSGLFVVLEGHRVVHRPDGDLP